MNNKVKKKIIIMSITLLLMAGLVCVVLEAKNLPGGENDPLVTKSYVDSKMTAAGGLGSFMPVEIKAGSKVLGGEGSEMILRSGEATAIDNGSNGISDLTDGKELRLGNFVEINHHLLIPREDGRGIAAKTDIWIMVRGTYKLQ